MASIRTNDFAFVFLGNSNFALTEVSPSGSEMDMGPYQRAVSVLSTPRKLVCVSTGAPAGDQSSAVRQIVAFIKQKAGNRLDTVGSVSMVGCSNGCFLVLAVAAELKKMGAPQLNYVGTTDLPVFPFGRDPATPNIGALKPVNAPECQSIGDSARRFFPVNINYPSVENDPPPKVSLDAEINAGDKRNFYQTQGNHIKFMYSQHRWWWWSGMSNGEVHGIINGFSNRSFIATGGDDNAFHIDICDRSKGKPFGQMLDEAGNALAFVP